MALPYDRLFNFSAGPGTLPVPVLETVRDELLNKSHYGMSVMEMSHRSEEFESILDQTETALRQILDIPLSHALLFLSGGATQQFSNVPLAFRGEEQTAEYFVTGTWGVKARQEAQRFGPVTEVASANDHIPLWIDHPLRDETAYRHITSNETIEGVQFSHDPLFQGALVCDMSSDIMSRPVDWSRYQFVYAGAQKNMGPAGVTVVIADREFLGRTADGLPQLFDYRLQLKSRSLFNTPPTFPIYVVGLVAQYWLTEGGLSAIQARNKVKARLVYDAIDQSSGFYRGHARKEARSIMNPTFTLPSEILTETFVREARAIGMDGLAGHRSVGGIRASMYNAFPTEGAQLLADFMADFARRHG